jgi:hypothetical protein
MSLPKIFSRTGRRPQTKFDYKGYYPLQNWLHTEPNIIYHYQIYDKLNNRVELRNCLDECHWQHLRTDPTTIFLYENSNETFDLRFCRELAIQIQLRNLPQEQIVVVVCDQEHKTFLQNFLEPLGININIQISWQSIANTPIPETDKEPMYKFSCLSRNYRPWRMRVFVDLLHRGLLNEFIYTFHNIVPYGVVKNIPIDTLKQDLKDMQYDVEQEPLSSWVNSIPHTLDDLNDVTKKFHDSTFAAIQRSDLHLIIETHFDPHEYVKNRAYDPLFQPSFLTEKTYKAIACARPFMIYSIPGCLATLKRLGFKTFDGLIDEDYDSITDNTQRHKAILDEIERLDNMDRADYAVVMGMCRQIALHNQKHLQTLKDQITQEHESTLRLLQQSEPQV